MMPRVNVILPQAKKKSLYPLNFYYLKKETINRNEQYELLKNSSIKCSYYRKDSVQNNTMLHATQVHEDAG